MKGSPILANYPGKADDSGSHWLPLWMHSMDAAGILERMLDNWLPACIGAICGLPAPAFYRCCLFAALVHDIGKLTLAFSLRILEPLPKIRQRLEELGLRAGRTGKFDNARESPHALAGEALLLGFRCPAGLAAAVGAHHGKPQGSKWECEDNPELFPENYYGDRASKEAWMALQKEFFSWALEEAGYSSVDRLPEISQPAQVLLTGLLIMADWIASNTEYFPLISTEETGDTGLYPARVDRAWEKLNLPCPWTPMCFAMDETRFREVFGFAPNAVQRMMFQAVNESGSGLYILEAQMGAGKTEAALAAAEVLASRSDSGGIFFGLPTQATANGLFARLTDWAETQAEDTRQAIRLAHGLAELNEDYRALFHGTAAGNEDAGTEERLIVHPWFSGHKQALLANFVIGTVDQLLLAALKQKHVMLRHLGLAGKVVVLDECHAYDAYMNQYLDTALRWLGAYGVPVIVLSATLPERRRAELMEAYLNMKLREGDQTWRTRRAYPLLTWTEGQTVRQTTVEADPAAEREVEIRNLPRSAWIDPLQAAVAAGGCCGVIVNTVCEAQALAREAAEKMKGAEVVLLHSQFVAADRAEKEVEILRRAGKGSAPEDRKGLVVIGTQVLVQSLDIDFDLLITQLCPMDLLLQRLGRLHRHKRSRPEGLETARCYVLDLDGESDRGSRAVYGDWLLLRTRELLPERITLPRSIPELVQEAYRDPEWELLDQEHRAAWDACENKLKDKKNRAKNYCLAAPPRRDSRLIKTIDGWLNNASSADGARGEAAVRDGESGITVLAMQERASGEIGFLPWREGGGTVSAAHVPDEETARKIARQRLTLPHFFSSCRRAREAIEELEALNRKKLPEWQRSGWLNGELVLLFDGELRVSLCGQNLRYTRETGLLWGREEDKDDPAL